MIFQNSYTEKFKKYLISKKENDGKKIYEEDKDDIEFNLQNDLIKDLQNSNTYSTSLHNTKFILSRQEEEDQNSNPDDIVCLICNDGDYEDNDLIVYCSSCQMTVHQSCYGIVNIPKEDWICYPCLAFELKDSKEVQCILCPVIGGAMKPCSLKKSAQPYTIIMNIRKGMGVVSKEKKLHSQNNISILNTSEIKNNGSVKYKSASSNIISFTLVYDMTPGKIVSEYDIKDIFVKENENINGEEIFVKKENEKIFNSDTESESEFESDDEKIEVGVAEKEKNIFEDEIKKEDENILMTNTEIIYQNEIKIENELIKKEDGNVTESILNRTEKEIILNVNCITNGEECYKNIEMQNLSESVIKTEIKCNTNDQNVEMINVEEKNGKNEKEDKEEKEEKDDFTSSVVNVTEIETNKQTILSVGESARKRGRQRKVKKQKNEVKNKTNKDKKEVKDCEKISCFNEYINTKTATENAWVHLSCALWLPEVFVADFTKKEEIKSNLFLFFKNIFFYFF
jgi:hypothetical protein